MDRVKTVAEFEMLMDPVFSDASEAWRNRLAELRIKYIKKFRELNPTFEQINHAKKVSQNINAMTSIIESNMDRVKTVAEFEMLMDPVFSDASEAWRNRLAELRIKYIKKFRELNPTFEQINHAKKVSQNINAMTSIIESNMDRVKTVAEFEMLMDPVFSDASEAWRNRLAELRIKYVKKFRELNPTFEEINHAKKVSQNINAMTSIIESNMDRVKTVAEFEMLMDPVFSDASEAWRNRLAELRIKYVKKFRELNPTFEQINHAKRVFSKSIFDKSLKVNDFTEVDKQLFLVVEYTNVNNMIDKFLKYFSFQNRNIIKVKLSDEIHLYELVVNLKTNSILSKKVIVSTESNKEVHKTSTYVKSKCASLYTN
jgi:Tfp pilus assembly protein PilP